MRMFLPWKNFSPSTLISISVLVFLWLVVTLAHYQPGKWLLGWDNLVPEFNFGMNIGRSLSAAWQEYQGVGLLGGMGHAADLPRQIILWIFSILLPVNQLRFAWVSLMWLLGSLGVWQLVRWLVPEKVPKMVANIGGVTAAVLYLFNLATVQYFYTPFETFSSLYGWLPWMFLTSLLYLHRPSKKNGLFFLIIHWLGSTAFYVQTLFVVYVMVLGLLCFEKFIKPFNGIKKSIFLFFLLFVANGYWLVPTSYFSLTNQQVVFNAKINVLSTEDTILMNQNFANWKDVFQLKGYWFDYTDWDGGQFKYLMPEWREYVQDSNTKALLISIFIFGLVGCFTFFLIPKNKHRSLGVVLVVLGTVMLLGNDASTASLFTWLSENVPILSQIFRSVFTKWSIILSFGLSLGLGALVIATTQFLGKVGRIVSSVLALLIMVIAVGTTFPILDGKMISKNMYVDFPQEYLELFDFFKTQPKQARIAFAPVQSFWGWNFYYWGYRGSGFLWYGIEQPILDRAFDVWSKENERFYHQFSYAVYNQDSELVRSVLDQYQVTYVLLDESVIFAGQENDQLYREELKTIMSQIGGEVVWNQGKLTVYKVRGFEDFVRSGEYALVGGSPDYVRYDQLYQQLGDYVVIDSAKTTYPFVDLYGEDLQGANLNSVFSGGNKLVLNREFDSGSLLLPRWEPGLELPLNGNISFQENSRIVLSWEPVVELKLNGQTRSSYGFGDEIYTLPPGTKEVAVVIGQKITRLKSGQSERVEAIPTKVGESIDVSFYDLSQSVYVELNEQFLNSKMIPCWQREGYQGKVSSLVRDNQLITTVTNASGCVALRVGEFESESNLVSISLSHRSNDGAKPHFCFVEQDQQKCLHEDVYYNSSSGLQWSVVERTAIADKSVPYWLEIVARPSEALDTSTTIDYQSPVVSVAPLLARFSNSAIWSDFKSSRVVTLEEGELLLELNTKYYQADWDNLPQELEECGLLERGKVHRKRVSNRSVQYSASNRGISCDYIILRDYQKQSATALYMESENLSGRGIRTYINDLSDYRVELEWLNPKQESHVFKMLLPRLVGENIGYKISFENKSFGSDLSKNEISDLKLFQMPLSWLSRIRVIDDTTEVKDFGEFIHGEIRKKGTYFYKTTGMSDSSPGIISLSQGFHPGWVAFQFQGESVSWVKKWFPWIGGNKLEHVKVNGWANGWVVPGATANGQPPTNNSQLTTDNNQPINNSPSTIVIIFWPQYLQWLGFGMLGLGIAGMTWLSVREYFRRKKVLSSDSGI